MWPALASRYLLLTPTIYLAPTACPNMDTLGPEDKVGTTKTLKFSFKPAVFSEMCVFTHVFHTVYAWNCQMKTITWRKGFRKLQFSPIQHWLQQRSWTGLVINMLNPRNESALIVQNGLIKAAWCVFDGYQLLSMLGYDPELLPCVCFLMIGVYASAGVCVCRCMNAWGCIDILSQWDLWETGAGGPLSSPLPQTNAFAISPFRGEGGQTRRPAWKYVSGAAR